MQTSCCVYTHPHRECPVLSLFPSVLLRAEKPGCGESPGASSYLESRSKTGQGCSITRQLKWGTGGGCVCDQISVY